MDVEQQVGVLLAAPPPDQVLQFFNQVTQSSPGLEVRLDAGEGKGKGVFAIQGFEAGSVLISELPLVGIQHTSSRPLALVCSHCFQYIGSVEQQIGMRLTWSRTAAAVDQCGTIPEGSDDASANGSSTGSDKPDEQLLGALLTGELRLPLADQVPLPEGVSCPGGCSQDIYCSPECAQAAWQQYHSLLCVGEPPAEASPSPEGQGKAPVVGGSGESREEQEQRQQRRKALLEFVEHADETNDVFLLAAKVVAMVVLEAQQVLGQLLEQTAGASGSMAASSGSSSGQQGAGSSSSGDAPQELCWAALQAAWEPFAMGHKVVWWESLALPEDVSDEAEFRRGIQQLAADSLELLCAAIYDPRFPALFELRVWGSIIGMFELNNLNLFVPSPIQRWQNLIEELPDSEQEVVEEEVGTLLEALNQLDEDGCEGNAFYTLQSCINHSCVPNAHAFKRDEDTDGSAVILALRDIQAGEEVTISYVDEDASLEERAAELADYGFTCTCDKCSAEHLAQELLVA